MLLNNQIKFDSNKSGAASIVKGTDIKWLPIQTQVQQEVPFKIVREEVLLQDEIVEFDDLTQLENSNLFKFERMPARPFEFFEEDVMGVGIELDLDLRRIERSNYSLLDVLADVGGLSSVLTVFASGLLAVINVNNNYGQLVKKLYKIRA